MKFIYSTVTLLLFLAGNGTAQLDLTNPRNNIVNYDHYNYYDNDEEVGTTCCECVPFNLCGENNIIIDDGDGSIGHRFGGNRVVDVEKCPNVTQTCCRLPTAPPTCEVNTRSNDQPVDTPCECTKWDFCLENFRISDGTPSKTLYDSKTLPGHSKCPHSREVCCSLQDETTVLDISPDSTLLDKWVCVNPLLCGHDGFIITDGSGVLEGTNFPRSGVACAEPQVICQVPEDEVSTTTQVPEDEVSTTTQVPEDEVSTTTQQPEDQSCGGIRNKNGVSMRITGFKDGESQFGEFPWAGMILSTFFEDDIPLDEFLGGVILIHPRVMLTAAHKVVNKDITSLSIRIGEWDVQKKNEPADYELRLVESVVIHPRFNNRSLFHDVALVILTEPVVQQQHIRSICLAETLEEVDTTACVINGWGKDNFDSGNYQTVMKSVTLPLVPNRRCQGMLRRTRLGRWFKLHPSFVCAGGQLGKDACSSDGGGPLACPLKGSNTGEYLLVGITAWGIGCGENGVPGVYASVVADRRWISSVMDQRFPGHSSVKRQIKPDYAQMINAAALTQEIEKLTGNGRSCDPTTEVCPLATDAPTGPPTTEGAGGNGKRPRNRRRNKNKNKRNKNRRRNPGAGRRNQEA